MSTKGHLHIKLENIRKFLINKGFLAADEPVSFEELTGGVSCTAIMIVRRDERLVLKQALARIKVEEEVLCPVTRNLYETHYLNLVSSFLDPGIVPAIRLVDVDNYLFIMESAPPEFRSWRDVLLEGHIDTRLGSRIGEVLARIHNNTAFNPMLQEQFKPQRWALLTRIDISHRDAQSAYPELQDALQKIVDDTLARQEALCTADYNPKNTLVDGSQFMLVDHESAHYGDPALDLGVFLAHLFLKAIHGRGRSADYLDLVQSLWNGYCGEIAAWTLKDFERRVVQHSAAMMLGRIVGRSPVSFLDPEDKAAVEQVAKKAILWPAVCVPDISNLISEAAFD